jgi:orotidine-5'-phosphate decarboxylase
LSEPFFNSPGDAQAGPICNPLRNPLIIALDVDSEFEALRLAEDLAPWAGAFKVGPRLCYRYGQGLVQKISAMAPVFVDNKYFDISSTMEAAVRASFDAGASLVTIHALSGFQALSEMAKLESELRKSRPFVILNVTILTSWTEGSLPPVFKIQPISKHVKDLSQLVKMSGLTGLVCSARELPEVDTQGLFVVTPGIRFDGDAAYDQERVMTPAQALAAGARGLVVGRPILEAASPSTKAKQFLESMFPSK